MRCWGSTSQSSSPSSKPWVLMTAELPFPRICEALLGRYQGRLHHSTCAERVTAAFTPHLKRRLTQLVRFGGAGGRGASSWTLVGRDSTVLAGLPLQRDGGPHPVRRVGDPGRLRGPRDGGGLDAASDLLQTLDVSGASMSTWAETPGVREQGQRTGRQADPAQRRRALRPSRTRGRVVSGAIPPRTVRMPMSGNHQTSRAVPGRAACPNRPTAFYDVT